MTFSFASSAWLAAGTLALAMATPTLAQELPVQNRTVVGAAVIYTPAYPGSDDYRFLPVPVVEFRQGRFFANPRKGLGVNVVRNRTLTLGAGVTYVPGYRRQDAPPGIGQLSGGAGARFTADLRTPVVRARFGATKILSGGVEGALVDANLSFPFRASSHLILAPGVSTTWADRRYTERFYGVTAAQAAASGSPAFQPGGGIRDVSATLGTTYLLSDRVSLAATGAVNALMGDVKDSPIVSDPTQPTLVVSATYRF